MLRHAVALLLGAAVALCAVAVHRSAVPLGLVLAVATSFAVPLWLLRSRWPRAASTYVLGWGLMIGSIVAGRPEGDYALSTDLPGYVLLVSGLGLLALAIVGLAGPRATAT